VIEGGESAVPAWATAIIQGIAESIEGLLTKFGISSWTDLLEKFKEGSISFWGYVTTKIPDMIDALGSIFNTVKDAIGGDIVSRIVGWLQRGFNWLINEGPAAVARIVEFAGMLNDLVSSVWTWFQDQNWSQIWIDIKAKFEEFKSTLSGMLDFSAMQTELERVTQAIDNLKTVMKFVIAIAAGAIIGGIGGALAPLTFGFSIGGAALGALAGGAIGGVIAGFFDKGGIIPGPIGAPRLIVGHGGENVQTMAQQSQGAQIYNEVRVYIGDEEVTDLVAVRLGNRSRSLTGNRRSLASLNRRG